MKLKHFKYSILFYLAIIGFATSLLVHVAAYCGYALLPPPPWQRMVGVIVGAAFVLTVWRNTSPLKWVKTGPLLLRHMFGILSIQSAAYIGLDLVIKVIPADAGAQYASRPVVSPLLTMTGNQYELFHARSFSAMI